MRTTLIAFTTIVLVAGLTGCNSGSSDDVLDSNTIYDIEGDWMTNKVHAEAGLPYPVRITKIDDVNYTVRMWSCGDTLHTGIRTGNSLTYSEVPPITLTFTDATHFIMTRDNGSDLVYDGVKCIGDCLYCD